MKVIGKYSSLTFIDYSVGLPIATILTCYALAVALGHVKAWFPMISDCGAEAPEKYIFRLGLITSAGLIARAAKTVRDYMDYTADLHGCRGSLHSKTAGDISVWLATIGSVGLAGCAAVSEKEDNPVHSTSAVIFFVMYIPYMWLITARMQAQGVKDAPHWDGSAHTIRKALSLLCTVDFIIFILQNVFKVPIHPYQALAEWTGVLLILIFNVTFRLSFERNGKNFVYQATAIDDSLELQDATSIHPVGGHEAVAMLPPNTYTRTWTAM